MGFNSVITLLNCAIEHEQQTEYIPHSQHQLGWFYPLVSHYTILSFELAYFLQ